MRNKTAILALAAFLMSFLPAVSAAPAADLSGTWVGTTRVPDRSEPDKITLVLKKTGDEYAGTVSDSLGLVKEAALKDVEFDDDELTFIVTVPASDGSEPVEVEAELLFENGTLTGSWSVEDGPEGGIVLEKMK
jgi:hypothetical protein